METLAYYWPWLFLLLPVAYLFGWLKGRRHSVSVNQDSSETLSSEYFKGLNYLLSDQQDRALPVFLQLVQVDNDTIDTHLAIATIYRRRGDYEKAIKIHQNLIAKPSLSAKYRSKALLELGRDYLTAGLFDRAEGLFDDVIKNGFYEHEAHEFKLTIYQREKAWLEAVKVAKTLIQNGDNSIRGLIAQFYCELSEKAFLKGNIKQAGAYVKDALAYDSSCIRALICRVQYAVNLKKYKEAIKLIKQIQQTDSDYFPAILPYCITSYRELGKIKDLIGYLRFVEKQNINLTMMDTISGLLSEIKDDDAAQSYLQEQLSLAPNITGLASFAMLMNKKANYSCDDYYQEIQKVIISMKPKSDQYHCNKCGYTSGKLNWQCPSCHVWGETKPVIGNINAAN
jgi:lipopolysaccharide assembly protein B